MQATESEPGWEEPPADSVAASRHQQISGIQIHWETHARELKNQSLDNLIYHFIFRYACFQFRRQSLYICVLVTLFHRQVSSMPSIAIQISGKLFFRTKMDVSCSVSNFATKISPIHKLLIDCLIWISHWTSQLFNDKFILIARPSLNWLCVWQMIRGIRNFILSKYMM